MRGRISGSWCVCLALAVVVVQAEAAELVVSQDGPYATIAEAIQASQPGDTVRVLAGDYQEQEKLEIGHPLRLEGTGAREVRVTGPAVVSDRVVQGFGVPIGEGSRGRGGTCIL